MRETEDTAAMAGAWSVAKRNGGVEKWNPDRVTRSVALAIYAERNHDLENQDRHHSERRWGVGEADLAAAQAISKAVEADLRGRLGMAAAVSVDEIGLATERAIAKAGMWEVARRFVLYRSRHQEMNAVQFGANGLQEYIASSKYTRYRADLGRREIFKEAADRVRNMHLDKFKPFLVAPLKIDDILDELAVAPELRNYCLVGGTLEDAINKAFAGVSSKQWLPSMRSLQFGGEAVMANNARIFNCAFGHIARIRAFSEAMFLLLSGCGVGFSVQRHHVDRLPTLPVRTNEDDLPVEHYMVADTIEGWADALEALLNSYAKNVKLEINYSGIRPRGTPLKSSGGKAPGHLPLKRALMEVEKVLDRASGRKLKPIEAYDIIMFAARAVLSGGIRRSATIALFSADDMEMASAKTGDWYPNHPQRSGSNNSAVLVRSEANESEFNELFEKQKEFGEPGFYFSESAEYGTNPCSEIGLAPFLAVGKEEIEVLRKYGYEGPLVAGDALFGFQMCNLTTINGGLCSTREAFLTAASGAAVIGTLQAAYTDIPYLGAVTRVLNEREALLGVSVAGFMDNPAVLLDPAVLEAGAAVVKAVNAIVARQIGINRAARCTAVKPDGTSSLLLNTGAGIHPHHAKKYFRRVQANRLEPVYSFFKLFNEHMTEPSAGNKATDDIITFPAEAPEGAILRDDISAVKFLETVKLVQRHWVQEGRAHEKYNPSLHHNVSNTVTVREEEWEEVRKFIWENREYFTGISLLQYQGDKVYTQAPREAVVSIADIQKWNRLRYEHVDYTQMYETEDNTAFKDIVACAGGACEIP